VTQIEHIQKELSLAFHCPNPTVATHRKETLLYWSKKTEYLELALESNDVVLWFYRNSETGACEGGLGYQDELFTRRLRDMY